jgi:hypothetical protein
VKENKGSDYEGIDIKKENKLAMLFFWVVTPRKFVMTYTNVSERKILSTFLGLDPEHNRYHYSCENLISRNQIVLYRIFSYIIRKT